METPSCSQGLSKHSSLLPSKDPAKETGGDGKRLVGTERDWWGRKETGGDGKRLVGTERDWWGRKETGGDGKRLVGTQGVVFTVPFTRCHF